MGVSVEMGEDGQITKGLTDYEMEFKYITVALGAASGWSFFSGRGIVINSLER